LTWRDLSIAGQDGATLHRLVNEAGDPGEVLNHLSDGQKAAYENYQRERMEKQQVWATSRQPTDTTISISKNVVLG
jgi:hypothetical protein